MFSKSNHQRSARPEGPGEWRVCCISPSRAIREEVAPVVTRCFPEATVDEIRRYPGRVDLAHELGRPVPDVCFIDMISDRDCALALMPEILKLNEGINLIAVVGAGEPDVILKCLRMGVNDFLQQPFAAEQLQSAIPKLTRIGNSEASHAAPAKIYCVIPAKGACGATTLACNLAFQFKRLGHKRILLADMDPLTGTVSFLLKLNSAYSFVDVLQRAATLDADLWKAMVSPCNGIDVLLAPELLMQGIGEVNDASPILDFARRNYDIVILDAGSAYGEWNLSQARGCDEVLLVTTNELPALHGAQRSLAYLEANRVPRRKLRLIINRFDKQIGLTKEVVASALHTDVLHTIPSDYETMQKALIDGKPIPHNSALGKTFAALGEKLAGREKVRAPRVAPFGSLLALLGRTSS
jgi:pilus assembly protein CpaE